MPDAAGEAALLRQIVDEELLYRQALALDLGRDDVVVRRILVQKIRLLAVLAAKGAEVSDAELRRYLAATASAGRSRHA